MKHPRICSILVVVADVGHSGFAFRVFCQAFPCTASGKALGCFAEVYAGTNTTAPRSSKSVRLRTTADTILRLTKTGRNQIEIAGRKYYFGRVQIWAHGPDDGLAPGAICPVILSTG